MPPSIVKQLPAHVAACCNPKSDGDAKVTVRRAPAEAEDLASRLQYDCGRIDDNFNLWKAAARRHRKSASGIRSLCEDDDHDDASDSFEVSADDDTAFTTGGGRNRTANPHTGFEEGDDHDERSDNSDVISGDDDGLANLDARFTYDGVSIDSNHKAWKAALRPPLIGADFARRRPL